MDRAVILSACRTPIGSFGGALSDVLVTELGRVVIEGAIERAGKQLTAARITGAGMRGKVTALNALLALRCVFLEHSWTTYWDAQAQLAA